MRIFLTGGSGYLGNHLVKRFARSGHEVTVLTRQLSGSSHLTGLSKVHLLEGSLTDLKSFAPYLYGHEALVHNAILWEDNDQEYGLEDFAASAQLFLTAANAKVGQILYSSSTAVHRPFRNMMNEETPIVPLEPYGACKAATEIYLAAFGTIHGMSTCSFRLGPIVGYPAFEGGPFKSDRTIQSIVDSARSGKEIRISEGAARQFIAADDAASLFVMALEEKPLHETYLAADPNLTTWHQIAQMAVSRLQSRSPIVVEPSTGPTPRFIVDKVMNKFGLELSSTLAMEEHLDHLTRN